MGFKIYRQDLKVTGEGLVMFKLESGRGDRDYSLFKKILNCSIALPCLFFFA